MRSPQEIDNARCIVGSILQDAPPMDLDPAERMALQRLEDALCWVMGLDCCHARNFAAIVHALKTQALEMGWQINLREPPTHVRDVSTN